MHLGLQVQQHRVPLVADTSSSVQSPKKEGRVGKVLETQHATHHLPCCCILLRGTLQDNSSGWLLSLV